MNYKYFFFSSQRDISNSMKQHHVWKLFTNFPFLYATKIWHQYFKSEKTLNTSMSYREGRNTKTKQQYCLKKSQKHLPTCI